MPTQKKDIFALGTGGIGIEYTSSSQTWTVKKNVFVGGNSAAVLSEYNNSKLINNGDLFSYNFGVHFLGNDAKLVNEKNGTILSNDGVVFGEEPNYVKNGMIDNYGAIRSFEDNGLWINSSNFVLNNYGKITAPEIAIQLNLDAAISKGPTIKNKGVIRSTNDQEAAAIYGEVGDSVKVKIVNTSKGTIEGAYSIYVELGHLDLHNNGKIKGMLFSEAASNFDKIVNKGVMKGPVFLGGSNDIYKNKGGKAGKIYSGEGDDTLVAGASKDEFVFDALYGSGVDTVKKFESGKDKFYIDKAMFPGLTGPGGLKGSEFRKGNQAQDSDDYLLYHKKSGELYYDKDADGAAAPFLIAKLEKDQKLTADDFTVVVLA